MSIRTIGTDKISNRFPVVGGFFRRSEIVDRSRTTAVNRTFTIRTATSRRLGEDTTYKSERAERRRERIVRRHFRGVVCMAFTIASSYTVTTPSCFRYACLTIFVPLREQKHSTRYRVSLFNQFILGIYTSCILYLSSSHSFNNCFYDRAIQNLDGQLEN